MEKKNLTKDKKAHWKKLKNDFLNTFPEGLPVEIDWGYEDTKYYHPIVWVTDKIYIHYQCDLDSDNIYGEQVNFKGLSNDCSIYFEDGFTKEYLFNNTDIITEKLNKTFEESIKLEESIKQLENIKRNLLRYTIPSYIAKVEKRKLVRTLEDVTEFVETVKVI